MGQTSDKGIVSLVSISSNEAFPPNCLLKLLNSYSTTTSKLPNIPIHLFQAHTMPKVELNQAQKAHKKKREAKEAVRKEILKQIAANAAEERALQKALEKSGQPLPVPRPAATKSVEPQPQKPQSCPKRSSSLKLEVDCERHVFWCSNDGTCPCSVDGVKCGLAVPTSSQSWWKLSTLVLLVLHARNLASDWYWSQVEELGILATCAARRRVDMFCIPAVLVLWILWAFARTAARSIRPWLLYVYHTSSDRG